VAEVRHQDGGLDALAALTCDNAQRLFRVRVPEPS
jgi:hypothetical protein